MKCPQCNSNKTIKNGRRRGKQSYRRHDCSRQFVESPIDRVYPPEVKQLCLKMYLNGMGTEAKLPSCLAAVCPKGLASRPTQSRPRTRCKVSPFTPLS